jgi:hypothetical protein
MLRRNASQCSFSRIVAQADAAVVEEAGERRPALEHVIHGLGEIVATRQLGPLLVQPAFQIGDQGCAQLLPNGTALLDALAIDRALDVEQRVDALNRFQRQRRDHAGGLALCLAAGVGGDIGHNKERPASVDPTPRLDERARFAVGLIELGVAAIGVGLEDPGIAGQMRPRMLAAPVARVIKHCRRRRRPGERPVVAQVDPTSPGVGLALGQDWHDGVVAVQSLSREDVALDPLDQRRQRRAAAADLIGQGRQAERHALTGIAIGLTVQGLVLPELLEQDHRQQAWAGPAAGQDMEGRRRLADLLAIAAGELLAGVLDHLPLPGNDLQRLGDVLAQLAPPRAAAAQANRRPRLDHPLAQQMLGKGLARRALAGEGHDIRGLGHGVLGGDLVLGRRTLELLEGQRHLIDQLHTAFRALAVELARQLGDLQPLMRDQGLIIGSLGLGHCQFGLDPRRSFTLRDQRRLQRGNVVGEVIGRRRHEPDYPTSAGPSAPSTIR